jgi:hypothetical protein
MFLQMLLLCVALGAFPTEVFPQFVWQVGSPVTFGVKGLGRRIVATWKSALFGVAEFEPPLIMSAHIILVPEFFLTKTDEDLAA